MKIFTVGYEGIEHRHMPGLGVPVLCYEADASDCHRRYVVEEMNRHQKGKLKVENLVLKQQTGLFLFRSNRQDKT